MLRKIIWFAIIFIPFFSTAQSFSDLSSFKENGSDVRYKKEISTVVNKTVDEGYEVYHTVITKIDSKSGDNFLIVYDPGPSDDPGYIIYKQSANGSLKEFANIWGEKIIIPGTGFIYTEGIANRNFYTYQKFKLEKDTLIEVKQPAYYVGLKSKTNQAVVLYSEKNNKHQVASLPKDYEVEIVLNDGDWFLVKTAFGLLGWVFVPDGSMYPPPGPVFEGLYFHGD